MVQTVAPESGSAKAPCLPTDEPPFTIGDLKRAIPPHCFVRNTAKSMSYVAHDVVLASIFLYLASFIDTLDLHPAVNFALWALYGLCQGIVCTGLWVIAHECGHRAFSDNEALGDLVGTIFHSLFLVPYHAWRISHRKHHSRTNHLTEDEVFIPDTREEAGAITPYEQFPGVVSTAMRLFYCFRMLAFGWPAYLLTHVTGRKYGARTNHFEPNAPLFADSERKQVVQSDLALFAVVSMLAYGGYVNGALWLVKVYVVPYFWVNAWLVLITFLQHTDVRLPHYRSEEWTWLKGALCTMDRDYGILNHFHHHISDTHVCHHLFSRIPHYHAEEATAALKKVLGPYYLKDNVSPGLRGVGEALWNAMTYCRVVETEDKVAWFKDR